MSEPSPVTDIAELMGQLARDLQIHSTDMDATLDAIAQAAVTMVPGADHCSISRVIRRHRMITDAATDEVARALDRAQGELGDGPCMQAELQAEVIYIPDASTDERWQPFTQRAVELGVGSMLCIQLYVCNDELGALNLHADRAHGFDVDSIETGVLFASHAAVAVVGAEREQQFREALISRDLIGQAKGILIARYDVAPGAAFDILVRVSQQTNRKLADVARQVIRDRDLSHVAVPPR